jgi:hypothetical protein
VTELDTHDTKGGLIDTTKVSVFVVMVVCRRSNESLISQGIDDLSPNVDQVGYSLA